jgi:hypothetical protein
MFGFGSVPLTSYFKTAPGASQDTRFSPAARMLFAQQEEMQREQEAQQRRQQAEQLANQLLGQAPGMSEQQLNQELLRNPAVFGSGLEGLSRYQQFRQQVAPSQSDEVLGPAFLKKITDPRHAERFQQRMLQEGMSANDAWEAYRTDEYNDKFSVELAEAGVPGEEFASLQVNGKFDPVAVTRRVAQAKKESTTRSGQPEIDRQLNRLGKVLDIYRKRVPEGEDPYEKDKKGNYKYPDLVALEQQYEKMAIESLLSPEEKAAARKMEEQAKAAGAVAPVASVVEETTEEVVVPEQQAARQTEKVREQEIKQKIGTAWSQAKTNIEGNLLKAYKPDDLDALAKAIVSGARTPQEALSQLPNEEAARVRNAPYRDYLITRLGLDPYATAFSEPENERWGTQDVTNQELLEVWAKDRLKGVEKGKKTGTVPKIVVGKPVRVTP